MTSLNPYSAITGDELLFRLLANFRYLSSSKSTILSAD